MPKIIHYMTERRPRVRLEDICNDICITWSIMGRPGKEGFRAKVVNILSEASTSNFKAYLRWNRRARSLEIVSNPLDIDPDKRTAAYRKLLTIQKNFIEKFKKGTVRGPRQLEFELGY